MRAGEAAQAAALAEVRPGMTELDACLIVHRAAGAALGDPAIVYGDFASGPRCEREKGGPPTSRIIEPGDLLLLDFSVIVYGYRGDFTNTFAVGGGPTARQRALFDACLGALRAGEARLKPGTAARDVDAAVRGHFASLGLDHAFTSHSGHGLGLGHPEPPYFVPESTDSLVEGDVVALEPGLYIVGEGGMRFERNYVITSDGFERSQITSSGSSHEGQSIAIGAAPKGCRNELARFSPSASSFVRGGRPRDRPPSRPAAPAWPVGSAPELTGP